MTDTKALRALLDDDHAVASAGTHRATITMELLNALPGLLDEVERLREAQASEREACAALCDRTGERWREHERAASDDFTRSRCFARADVAATLARAIRARGGR